MLPLRGLKRGAGGLSTLPLVIPRLRATIVAGGTRDMIRWGWPCNQQEPAVQSLKLDLRARKPRPMASVICGSPAVSATQHARLHHRPAGKAASSKHAPQPARRSRLQMCHVVTSPVGRHFLLDREFFGEAGSTRCQRTQVWAGEGTARWRRSARSSVPVPRRE